MLPTMTIPVRSEPPSRVQFNDASSVATLNPATMEVLQLFRGDSVIVRYVLLSLLRLTKELTRYPMVVARNEGTQARDVYYDLEYKELTLSVVLIVMSDENVEEGKILLNKGVC